MSGVATAPPVLSMPTVPHSGEAPPSRRGRGSEPGSQHGLVSTSGSPLRGVSPARSVAGLEREAGGDHAALSAAVTAAATAAGVDDKLLAEAAGAAVAAAAKDAAEAVVAASAAAVAAKDKEDKERDKEKGGGRSWWNFVPFFSLLRKTGQALASHVAGSLSGTPVEVRVDATRFEGTLLLWLAPPPSDK